MSTKDNAGSRRIMKREDYSHSDPIIYVPKDYITAIAFTLKDKYRIKYHTALNKVSSYLCGTNLEFNEFHQEHRYDLTMEQALIAFPDILEMYSDRLSRATGLKKQYIMTVLNKPENDLNKQRMASIYESETGLPACEISNVFSEQIKKEVDEKISIKTLCSQMQAALKDERPWQEKNALDLLDEIRETITKIRNGKIDKRKRERAAQWCKEQIEKTINHQYL